MPERPPSDRELDESIALAAVREQLPDLRCSVARQLGSGWASDVYLLDECFVAAFPRNTEVARWVDSDQRILGLVASELASAFGVPRVIGRARGGTSFPHDFLVRELVPGVPADRLAAPVSDLLASDLGRALTRIHAVPVGDACRAGLREVEWDDSGYAGPLHFLHGDFNGGNIIVDPETGRLAGVIDWGNAAIGDPALDFMPLVLWRGWRFMHEVLDAYVLPTDEDFVGRVQYHAQLQALQWLADSIRRRLDPELHLGWLRNAFSLDSPP
jgi:aminoglycoside 2''-phosphotransferase